MPVAWNNWISHLRRWGRRCLRFGRPDSRPTGAVGVSQLGHRDYVGGRWEEIGRLQFEYLVAQGLRPEHVLLDVACGSLRAGVHFIPYLNPDCYWGLEKEVDLIEAGVSQELDSRVRTTHRPQFLINAEFDVSQLTQPADYIWIHSLLTHLPLAEIQRCLTNLRAAAHSATVCYATYFETAISRQNHSQSHDHETFFYTREELRHCAESTGWNVEFIGDWGHPRGQQMLRLTKVD
jgi:hypothetical protein